MLNVELRFAVYWSRWNCWALLSAEDFHCNDSLYTITLPDSLKHNRMAVFGDYAIGTTPSLIFRLLSDATKPRRIMPDGEVYFTIGGAQMECGGKLITEHNEQRIAFYLMRYGRWTEETRAIIESGQLLGIEFEFSPAERPSTQRFSIVGFLSGMISRQYDERTTSSGRVARLVPEIGPDALGVAIPTAYRGQRLPLWRFTVQPTDRRTSDLTMRLERPSEFTSPWALTGEECAPIYAQSRAVRNRRPLPGQTGGYNGVVRITPINIRCSGYPLPTILHQISHSTHAIMGMDCHGRKRIATGPRRAYRALQWHRCSPATGAPPPRDDVAAAWPTCPVCVC